MCEYIQGRVLNFLSDPEDEDPHRKGNSKMSHCTMSPTIDSLEYFIIDKSFNLSPKWFIPWLSPRVDIMQLFHDLGNQA